MSSSPAFVLIPGAWHRATCYDRVRDILKAKHDIESFAVTLPSTCGDPNATLKDDIDATRAIITEQLNKGRDVVVVAHSYGGVVGNSSIKGLTRPKSGGHREPDSEVRDQGHVIGLVLLTTGFIFTGLAMMDPFCGLPMPFFRKNTNTGFAELRGSPIHHFYHDLPREEANAAVGQLMPHSLKSLYEGGEHAYAGWQDVPVWYIAATRDQVLPIAAQRLGVGLARGQGGDVTVREIESSHSPFLSRPEEFTGILVAAAAEFGRSGVDVEHSRRRREAQLVGLWPQRWLRAGFFMGTGEMIGRVIAGVVWLRRLWQS
jgi:pimeloyl-ACP methyl ester carboxylesterase